MVKVFYESTEQIYKMALEQLEDLEQGYVKLSSNSTEFVGSTKYRDLRKSLRKFEYPQDISESLLEYAEDDDTFGGFPDVLDETNFSLEDLLPVLRDLDTYAFQEAIFYFIDNYDEQNYEQYTLFLDLFSEETTSITIEKIKQKIKEKLLGIISISKPVPEITGLTIHISIW